MSRGQFLYYIWLLENKGLSIPVWPIKVFFNSEISKQAKIRSNIKIAHSCLGLVISKWAEIGNNARLFGGNVIGKGKKDGPYIIGDNFTMGVNSTLLDGCKVGNNVYIAANSIAMGDIPDNTLVVGNNRRLKR